MGYNWDQILENTRGYWVPCEEEEQHPRKFLTTMDLLKMRLYDGSNAEIGGVGYIPYWMSDEEKKSIKPNPNLGK